MMKKTIYKWEILNSKHEFKNVNELVDTLLANRNITSQEEKEEFFNPKDPLEIPLVEVGLKEKDVLLLVNRLEKAKKNNEQILVYGDYDADGICATAIMWETLYELGYDVHPFIPDRFDDGYGLNSESIKKLKNDNTNLGLIITVDNGVVAESAVEVANELGIDVVITDHHEPGEVYPKAHAIIHSQQIGGAGISWMVSREIRKHYNSISNKGLDLCALGTVADQIPLLKANRSFVRFGLKELNATKRVGLLALYKEAGLSWGNIDTYSIGFVIAPRLNAMGRLEHALDSLRLLCTTDVNRAHKLAQHVSMTNQKRQKIVEEVVTHARQSAKKRSDSVIVIAHESYHEGVIGLAASKLVEEFYRPAIVFSKLGKESKASARSIEGFNIIETIRKLDNLFLEAGGHPMAAGIKISTKNIDKFTKEINIQAKKLLTEEILTPRLRIDLEINFKYLSWELLDVLNSFQPTGSANKAPLFLTKKVRAWDVRAIGQDARHLKMKVKDKGGVFDAIGFGMGSYAQEIIDGQEIDIVYYFEENEYNGTKNMQLRLKDIKIYA